MKEQVIDGVKTWDIEGEVWTSQGEIAKLYGTTKQAVSLLTRRVNGGRRFVIPRLEGKRVVQRSMLLFPVDVAVYVGTCGGRSEIARRFSISVKSCGFECPEVVVGTRLEFRFGELLEKLLDDVVDVHSQHRVGRYIVDFYIPQLQLVVEYDEVHHKKKSTSGLDKTRQAIIERCGYTVIRIPEGGEISGINAIIHSILRLKALSQ